MLPEIEVVQGSGIQWLLLKSPDHISDFIRKNGHWGILETTICNAFLQGGAGKTVIDVGSNIGGFTIPVAKMLASMGGEIHAFEPQRVVFQQLCANAIINRLDNVVARNVAVSDESGSIAVPELDFARSPNVGGVTLDPEISKHLTEEARRGENFENVSMAPARMVPTATLDELEFDNGVAFVKIDVEGFELHVLRGALRTLESNRFPPIVFELWEGKDWYEQQATDTLDLLNGLGYSFEKFGREMLAQHPDHPVRLDVERDGEKINFNVVSANA